MPNDDLAKMWKQSKPFQQQDDLQAMWEQSQPKAQGRTVPDNWVQRMGGAMRQIGPAVQGLVGTLGQGGKNDLSPIANTAMNLSGGRLAKPLQNLPENIPLSQMGINQRFGPVIGTGINLARPAVAAMYPGVDVGQAAEKIPLKSLGYAAAGLMTPGGKEGIGAKALDVAIDKGIAKGIRPSAMGIQDYRGLKNYITRARDAVKTIFQNKENLGLVNEVGQAKLPETLEEFSQSVSKTKADIFQQYNAMAQAAGKQGVMIDLEPLAKEFDRVAADKINARLHPEVAKYAAGKAAALRELKNLSPEDAQAELAHVNAVTKAFQQNPNPSAVKNIATEAMYGNMLRKGLDNAIESAPGGPGYQELKSKYGALKTIEKDIAHRTIVDARKNKKGLIDFSDIASAAELGRGLITMSPAAIGEAGIMKGIAALYKHMNNPNTIVKNMFAAFEKPVSTVGRTAGMGATQLSAQKAGQVLTPSQKTGEQFRNLLDPASSALAADNVEAGMQNFMGKNKEMKKNSWTVLPKEPEVNPYRGLLPTEGAQKKEKERWEKWKNWLSKLDPATSAYAAENAEAMPIPATQSLGPSIYGKAAPFVESGTKAYLRNDYDTALKSFMRAMKLNPEKKEEFQKSIRNIRETKEGLEKFRKRRVIK